MGQYLHGSGCDLGTKALQDLPELLNCTTKNLLFYSQIIQTESRA